MDAADFERVARDVWAQIPQQYKEGIDGLIIDRSARPHDDDPDVYTLGECLTEEYPSQYGGPDTIRSAVVLYYGSFRAVARDDHEFDWSAEIHETVMHELQHHLESLATEAALEDYDYAVDQNFRRHRGERFDPLFYRAGEGLAVQPVHAVEQGPSRDVIVSGSVFLVEAEVFLEVVVRHADAVQVEWVWDDLTYRAVLPDGAADVTFHYVEGGLGRTSEFWIVRVLKRGALATLRSVLGGGYTVAEASVVGERVS